MKISKELLKQIIKEELENQKSFGTDSTSQSNRKQDLKQKFKDVSNQKGVDNRERGIVQRIEQNLAKLADLTDIKPGQTFAFLKRLNSMMEKQIEELQSGDKSNEE